MKRLKRFSTYGVGQGLAYAVDLASFTVLAHFGGAAWPVALNLFSKSLSALFAFFFHRRFTFPDADRRITWSSVLSFLGLLAVNMALTSTLLWGLTRIPAIPLLVAKVAADVVGVVVTFALMRTFVFPRSPAP